MLSQGLGDGTAGPAGTDDEGAAPKRGLGQDYPVEPRPARSALTAKREKAGREDSELGKGEVTQGMRR